MMSERRERTFAHVCETGGGRRSWPRGIANVTKAHVLRCAAYNLGLLLQKVFGLVKPRSGAVISALIGWLRAARLLVASLLGLFPVDRRWIENHGQFVPQNPNAPKARVSYTWNALLPHWIEWLAIVEEFLAAVDAIHIEGNIEPMFTFVTETLGEPWDLDR